MKRPHYTPPRQTFLGILLCQLSAVLMHVGQLPNWLWLPILLVFAWRWQIYRSRWALPGKVVRFLLVLASVLIIIMAFGHWYALEPMIVLLVLAFVLKMLELETRRDFIFVIFVGYVIVACAFILTQNISMTALGLIAIGLLTTGLISIHATTIPFFSRRMAKLLGLLTLQLLPIVLVLLFFFPRVGALWSIPALSEDSVTGISDSMSPGDFSNLSRSREIAFRVSFANDTPPAMQDRYWRGMVFSRFDGRRWSQDYTVSMDAAAAPDFFRSPETQPTLDYEVIMEPTNQTWLFTLPVLQNISLPIEQSFSNEVRSVKPITQRLRYKATTALGYNNRLINRRMMGSALQLPNTVNPQTREAAKNLRLASSSATDYINRILDWYRQEFTYTLAPPALGTHSIDEFLYQTKAGFCEHYASSFVFMMRSAGIPARVVVGYMGGEWNDEEKFLTVRQSDAHAWAEVYLPQTGWQRVDPTAAISPDRVQLGLEEALSGSDQALIQRGFFGNIAWIRTLGLRWEALNYRWQDFAMSYDQDQQSNLLNNLLGKFSPLQLAFMLLIPGILIPGLIALWSWLANREKRSPLAKLHQALLTSIQSRNPGSDLTAGSTFQQLINAAIICFPNHDAEWQSLSQDINHYLYNGEEPISRQQLRRWRELIKQASAT